MNLSSIPSAMGNDSTLLDRVRHGLAIARLLIGDIGIRVIVVAAIVIHATTVWIAFTVNEGAMAWVAAALSATVPAVPEVYWALHVAARNGNAMHPYVLAVIGYPVACALWLLGGWLFFPERLGGACEPVDDAE